MGECQQPSCPYTTVAGQKNHHQTCPSVILAPLAQLDRASGYEPEGREFESLRAHHTSVYILPSVSPTFRKKRERWGTQLCEAKKVLLRRGLLRPMRLPA